MPHVPSQPLLRARLLSLAGALLAACLASAARAEVPADDPRWQQLNGAVVEGHVIPRYAAFQRAANSLAAGIEQFCEHPDSARLSRLQAQFRQAQVTWAGVSHITMGPSEDEQRRWRIQLWPDKHGTAAKQLRLLIDAEDIAALAPERFRRGSVGVQGLPALERLLYPVKAPGELADDVTVATALAPNGTAGFQCALLRSIGENLATLATEITDGWSLADPPYREIVYNAGPDNPEIVSAKLASSLFLRDLTAGLERLALVQLARPLGERIEAARPTRAEAWRSGMSLDIVRANLESLRHLYETGFAPLLLADAGLSGLHRSIRRDLDSAAAKADGLGTRLASAVADPEARAELEQIQRHLIGARHALESKVSRALDLPVGFNSLDGD